MGNIIRRTRQTPVNSKYGEKEFLNTDAPVQLQELTKEAVIPVPGNPEAGNTTMSNDALRSYEEPVLNLKKAKNPEEENRKNELKRIFIRLSYALIGFLILALICVLVAFVLGYFTNKENTDGGHVADTTDLKPPNPNWVYEPPPGKRDKKPDSYDELLLQNPDLPPKYDTYGRVQG